MKFVGNLKRVGMIALAIVAFGCGGTGDMNSAQEQILPDISGASIPQTLEENETLRRETLALISEVEAANVLSVEKGVILVNETRGFHILSPEALTFAKESVAQLNSIARDGLITIRSDLTIEPTSRTRGYIEFDYVRWSWWGVTLGLSDAYTGRLANALQYGGGGVGAAIGVALGGGWVGAFVGAMVGGFPGYYLNDVNYRHRGVEFGVTLRPARIWCNSR